MMFKTLLVTLMGLSMTQGLRYNFGDGSYYIGEVDETGRPSGFGQFYNVNGDLGK